MFTSGSRSARIMAGTYGESRHGVQVQAQQELVDTLLGAQGSLTRKLCTCAGERPAQLLR